jgi:hypothetical protein
MPIIDTKVAHTMIWWLREMFAEIILDSQIPQAKGHTL